MLKKLIAIILVIWLTNSGCSLAKAFYETEFKSESLTASNCDLMDCVWVLHVSGIQCETTYFSHTGAAASFLKSNDIMVLDENEVYTPAHAACGYPNGLYFAAKIKNSDAEKAKSLGWRLLNKEEAERYNLN